MVALIVVGIVVAGAPRRSLSQGQDRFCRSVVEGPGRQLSRNPPAFGRRRLIGGGFCVRVATHRGMQDCDPAHEAPSRYPILAGRVPLNVAANSVPVIRPQQE